MTVLLMHNFRNLQKNSFGFLKSDFSHCAPPVRVFFVEKRERKIFGFKNVMERAIREIFTFVKLHLTFSEK